MRHDPASGAIVIMLRSLKMFGMAQAVEHYRKKVRFSSTVELVNTLEQEKARGKAGQIAESLGPVDLVILNEFGYLPFSASGGALLFHLLSKLYERTSVVITTKLSFSEWAVCPRARTDGAVTAHSSATPR